jgi:hypothetical protein
MTRCVWKHDCFDPESKTLSRTGVNFYIGHFGGVERQFCLKLAIYQSSVERFNCHFISNGTYCCGSGFRSELPVSVINWPGGSGSLLINKDLKKFRKR